MKLIRRVERDPMTAVLDPPTRPVTPAAPNDYAVVPLDRIRPSPLNPRKVFDQEALQELADSIAAQGILEPLVTRYVVTSGQAGGEYEILAGERRWRAAKLAGLAEAPVIVRYDVVTDEQAVRLMLVENLQRSDLNPIEEALAFKALHDIGGLTQAEIAKAVNRSQPAVANAMRVLDLPEDVRQRIRAGELTRGHGVALARYKAFPALSSALAAAAVEHKFTVKELERPAVLVEWRIRDALREHVVSVASWMVGFDTTICQSCPFDAYVPEGPTTEGHPHQPLCLKPAHAKELTAAATKARNAEVQRAVAATKAGGTAVLKIDRMAGGSYERLNGYAGRPAGCSTGCPCAATALDSHAVRPDGAKDGVLVPVCTDPKRLQSLREAERKAKRDAARQRGREIVASLPDRMAAIPYALDDELEGRLTALRRPLAVVASAALNGILTTDLTKALLARYGVDVPRVLHAYQIAPETLEAFAKLKLSTLLSLTAEAVLRRDLVEETERAGEGYGSWGKRLAWYLGETETVAREKEAP
jgi:ParB/RepB/Spo0J family partition protein